MARRTSRVAFDVGTPVWLSSRIIQEVRVPLWAIAFFTVALTAPPTATLFLMPPITVFAIAAVAIAAIVFLMPGSIPWLRTSRALFASSHPDSEIRRMRQSQ
jgi:hypothetical protein